MSSTPISAEELIAQAQAQLQSSLTNPQKLDIFFRLAASGKDIVQAMQESGLLENGASAAVLGFDPSNPAHHQLNMEELFYARCTAPLPTKEQVREWASHSPIPITAQQRQEEELRVVPDDHYDSQQHPRDKGWLKTTEVFALIDWLYFVRAMPLKSLAQSLRLPLDVVISIKSELSNESAKAIRRQSADGYISDLMRTKEILRQDLIHRRSKLTSPQQQQMAATIDKLIWQLENDFVDRLQQIGVIDKSLGRVEIHEEWSVTIGSAGQPINEKLKRLDQAELPAFLRDDPTSRLPGSSSRTPEVLDTDAIAVPAESKTLTESQLKDAKDLRERFRANYHQETEARVASHPNPEEIRQNVRQARVNAALKSAAELADASGTKTAAQPEDGVFQNQPTPLGHGDISDPSPRAAAVPDSTNGDAINLPEPSIINTGSD